MVISLKSFTRGTDAPLVGNIHSAPFLGLQCSVHTEKVEKRSRFLWVYCQKSENVYRFFIKIFIHTGYISKKIETVLAFFKFFQKKLSTGYIAKILKSVQVLPNLFQKNLLTSGILPKIPKTFSLFPNFFENLPIRYISRIFESVQVFQNFFQKNSLSTDDYQKKYPKRSHPFPTFCRKIFISLPAISPTWSDLCAILSLNLPPGK